jgi:light-harvesting complex I chlorophyll a/b binding protein 1
MQFSVKHAFLLALLPFSLAFVPLNSKSLQVRTSKSAPLQMASRDIRDVLPGQLAPTGFFDPLNLSKDLTEKELKKYREAEVKHGRVAMLAALAMLVQESFNPLFEKRIMGPAIYHFQQVSCIHSHLHIHTCT